MQDKLVHKRRLIVCANQVTVAIARSLVSRERSFETTYVLYDSDRCDVKALKELGIRCTPIRDRWSASWLLFWTCVVKKAEVCLPHRRFGRSILWFVKCTRSHSLIDDGLDTLRNRPRNVDPRSFRAGTVFYTFRYGVPLGQWLDEFAVEQVSDIEDLVKTSRPRLDLSEYQNVVIESPPLERVVSKLPLNADTLLIRHSNSNKCVLPKAVASEKNGADIALEASLSNFSGNVIVGESMVAVYALLHTEPQYKVVVFLKSESVENLSPLIHLIEVSPFAELRLC